MPSKDVPRPLPERRPRSLTSPLPDATGIRSRWQSLVARKPERVGQRTYEQRQSPLARLPLEIRRLIWDHYLCEQQLHIVCANRRYKKTSRGRLVGIKCSDPASFPCVDHECWGRIPVLVSRCRQYSAKEPRWYLGQFGDSTAEEVNFVALLRTCRLIYSEVVDLIYGNNVFCFENIDTIIALSRTVLPRRLDQIRRVRLTYHFPPRPTYNDGPDYDGYAWACEVLAKLSNLDELIIHLHLPLCMNRDDHLSLVLEPLNRIRQPRTFTVYMYGYMGENLPYVERMHFMLIIPPSWVCGKRRLHK